MLDITSAHVAFARHPHTCVWIRTDPVKLEWQTETIIRGRQGIYYHGTTYFERPNSTRLYFDTYQYGRFSVRPYGLFQATDTSCVYAVLDLFVIYGQLYGINTARALRSAEEKMGIKIPARGHIRAQADWEGVLIPSPWTPEAIDRLVDALNTCGFESLSAQIEVPQPRS